MRVLTETACRVCGEEQVRDLVSVGELRYLRCDACEATLLASAHLLEADAELAFYLTHRNDADDAGYRAFLARLVEPLRMQLAPGSIGLDYGCGPDSALAVMLEEFGHRVISYDPFFAPDASVLERRYDFVACTEVIEHFHQPADEFARLDRMLEPGGVLALMTCFQTDDARFPNWHYRRDPTHVVFYREHTLRRLADIHGWCCEIPGKDVALMRKPVADATISRPIRTRTRR